MSANVTESVLSAEDDAKLTKIWLDLREILARLDRLEERAAQKEAAARKA